MELVVTQFVIFVVDIGTLYLANNLFPDNVVAGTANISTIEALVLASGALTLIDTFTIPFVREFERIRDRKLTNNQWMILYLLLDFSGVWLVTRFAHLLGVGISAWYVALGLAVVLDLFQGVAVMGIERLKNRDHD